MKPRLLDLFCGAGGAAVGYARAGFEVVGVDIRPQPRYPFEFIQADALEALRWERDEWEPWGAFDAIHASPPCQRWSSNTATSGRPEEHPDLISPLRPLLQATGLPYVIENVPRSPLIDPVTICGVALGHRIPEGVLRQHRHFETSFPVLTPGCGCHRGDGTTLGVYGGGTSSKERNPNSKGGRPAKATAEQSRALMEMPWANGREIRQAIPPAYTELIGHQLMTHLKAVAA